jgi:hypothetical protein
MFDAIKMQVTATPGSLSPEKLEEAKGLAKILTEMRKFVYFFFSLMIVMSAVWMASNLADFWITMIIGIFGIMYLCFKLRDYVRGTI